MSNTTIFVGHLSELMHSTVAPEPGHVPRSVDGVLRARRRVRIVKAMRLPERGGRDLRSIGGTTGVDSGRGRNPDYNEASATYTVEVRAAGSLELNVDAIAGEDTVNIAEKAAGFAAVRPGAGTADPMERTRAAEARTGRTWSRAPSDSRLVRVMATMAAGRRRGPHAPERGGPANRVPDLRRPPRSARGTGPCSGTVTRAAAGGCDVPSPRSSSSRPWRPCHRPLRPRAGSARRPVPRAACG